MSDLESLPDFVASHGSAKSGPACQTCCLPPKTRLAVEDGMRAGYPYGTISAWLESIGFSVSKASIGNHKRWHLEDKT